MQPKDTTFSMLAITCLPLSAYAVQTIQLGYDDGEARCKIADDLITKRFNQNPSQMAVC